MTFEMKGVNGDEQQQEQELNMFKEGGEASYLDIFSLLDTTMEFW
jgi:hypothetical protein